MTITILLVLSVCFLAYSNGSNDNFKGVATLFGSGITNYRSALWYATATTFAGSVASIFLAGTLVKNFSGKGLVPDAIASSPEFLAAVVIGAGLCVLLATIVGLPISTTHGLTGALVGAGLGSVGTSVNFTMLGSKFLLPLLVSPFLALALASLAYVAFRKLRTTCGITREMCICIGEEVMPISQISEGTSTALAFSQLSATIDCSDVCEERYLGKFVGVNAQKLLNVLHYLSAGVVSFARGLNDTPKVVAALVGVQALGLANGMLLVGVFMALGGLLQARKVAKTMSKEITPLNHGQGFAANLVTGFLVVIASRMGVPVSTTHVSVGSIFGIGTITGQANKKLVLGIVSAWIMTLPLAAGLAAVTYMIIR